MAVKTILALVSWSSLPAGGVITVCIRLTRGFLSKARLQILLSIWEFRRSRTNRDAALGAGDSSGRMLTTSDADVNAANPLLREHQDEDGKC